MQFIAVDHNNAACGGVKEIAVAFQNGLAADEIVKLKMLMPMSAYLASKVKA